ncbi:MAG: MBL fold metallo-hydrolase [Woeseiaceae bacterium]|nr:MBL fold metallo-hydrolase [Woeseiaceae bacterium]
MSLVPGVPQQLAGGVRRLVAPNPGMMTGPGTNTYLLGDKAIAVIDPGPRIQSHLEAIRQVAGAAIRWILVTHTHPDHSPAARELAAETGAQLLGQPAPEGRHQDGTFKPGRVLHDGDVLQTDEFRLTALHTPGHASNHLCFLHDEHRLLFTGDHIINGSTVVIDPPDGNMRHYIDSLKRLLTVDLVSIAPGHGHLLTEPYKVIEWIIDHRLQRESRVVKALQEHSGLTSMALVPHAYADVDPDRYAWAERSLLAHLQKLADEGRATVSDGRWKLL